jgi:streptomycin 6-kinase
MDLPAEFISTISNTFGEAGVRWLARLPDLLAECVEQWSLAEWQSVEELSYNFVAFARRADGGDVILKIGVPNPELDSEIAALQVYDGRGAARLLAVDEERSAMLLERLRPGVPLARLGDDEDATRIAARVMRALWRRPPADHSFRTVRDWAAGMERLRKRFGGGTGPFPRELTEKAERLFAELLDSMADQVLLHGDLHHWNILSARREPWLAIDPKGIVGEPAYEVGALLRNELDLTAKEPDPHRVTARRVAILAEELGFERERLLAWSLAQAVLSAWWCVEDNVDCFDGAIAYAEIMDRVLLGRRG